MADTTSEQQDGGATWLPDAWWRLSLRHRRWVAGLVAAAVVLGVGVAATRLTDGAAEEQVAPTSPSATAGSSTPSGAAAFVSALPADRVAVWDALAECEAEGDWARVSPAGHYGGLQFTEQSWSAVGGSGLPHEHPREEQILRAELLRSIQGWQAWPSCSAQLGL